MILAMFQTINSSWLYVKAKDLTPGKPESLYELGFILYGRSSIFVISSILVFNAFGMCMIYFNLFATTAESLFDVKEENADDGYFTVLNYCKLGIGLVILPVCLKRELQELHAVSMLLFAAIVVFIFTIFLIEKISFPNPEKNYKIDVTDEIKKL